MCALMPSIVVLRYPERTRHSLLHFHCPGHRLSDMFLSRSLALRAAMAVSLVNSLFCPFSRFCLFALQPSEVIISGEMHIFGQAREEAEAILQSSTSVSTDGGIACLFVLLATITPKDLYSIFLTLNLSSLIFSHCCDKEKSRKKKKHTEKKKKEKTEKNSLKNKGFVWLTIQDLHGWEIPVTGI